MMLETTAPLGTRRLLESPSADASVVEERHNRANLCVSMTEPQPWLFALRNAPYSEALSGYSSFQSAGNPQWTEGHSSSNLLELYCIGEFLQHAPATVGIEQNSPEIITQSWAKNDRPFWTSNSDESGSVAFRPLLFEGARPLDYDPMDIHRRLESLKNLSYGWADGMQPAMQWGEGYGKAPTLEGLDWLARRFAVHYTADLPRPYLYPTPEGSVQAEWSLGPNEASLEIDLAARSAEWHCLNLDTGDVNERVLDIHHSEAWLWLAGELRRLESTPT